MKNFIFICLLLISVVALSMNGLNATVTNVTGETENIVVEESLSGYEIVFEDWIENSAIQCCVANVYYMGHWVNSFQCCKMSGACACAEHMACEWIQSQGGTCPIGL